MTEAGLWTDGRYFIQAEQQLAGSTITLYLSLIHIYGKVLNTKQSVVSRHEYKKFLEIYQAHVAAPRSKLYLADGYDMVRYYTEHMNIEEKKEKRERGILILYAMPDTKKLHLSEAQAYDVVWNTFQEIQKDVYKRQI